MKLVLLFSIVHLLSLYLLAFFNVLTDYSYFFIILFYTILFIQIQVSSYFIGDKIDEFMKIFALNIGLKFLVSLLFISAMYYLEIYKGVTPVIIFVFYYFIYTYFLSTYGNNRLKTE